MFGSGGGVRRVDVITSRSRPDSCARCATFWMNRHTPFTSAIVSVNRLTRIERSSTLTPVPSPLVSCSKRSRKFRSLFW